MRRAFVRHNSAAIYFCERHDEWVRTGSVLASVQQFPVVLEYLLNYRLNLVINVHEEFTPLLYPFEYVIGLAFEFVQDFFGCS